MKLNNKGITLIELLLSIVLIGIVLLFIFQLLVDLRGERDSNSFAYYNQLNRMDAVYKIGRDIYDHKIVGIVNRPVSNTINIDFNYQDNATASVLSFTPSDSKYISYTDFDNKPNKWKMTGISFDNCYDFTIYKDETVSKFYLKLNIYVYNKPYHELNNKENNNIIDDIEFTYVGNISDIDNTISNNLLNLANGTYNYCAN